MRLSKKIMLHASLIIVLANVVVLHLVTWRYEAALQETLTESARSFYKLIVIVRAWVAENEGVYVKQRPGAVPNRYLPRPVLESVYGDSLLWRNPAMVTRELSELSQLMGKRVQFHITSLDAVNPTNAPDEFERQALLAIDRGDREVVSQFGEFTRFETIDGAQHFRYFAPLYTEESCLSCHGDDGYKVGDLRGGISVIMPTDRLDEATGRNYVITLLGAVAASAAVSLIIFWLLQRTVVRPLRRLEDAAQEIGKGNYDTQVLADSEDEIGDVGRAMTKMQRAIRLSVDKQVQAEKMFALGRLSAGMAHEIRNPLFAIRNDLDYLQRNYRVDEQLELVYREMEEGVHHIGNTVNAVLSYAKPHRPEYGRHSFDEVLRSCMALLGKQLEKERIEVSIQFDEDMPAVEMDVHQMEQVFVNLLTNAISARVGPSGHMRITGGRTGDSVAVRVEDDGCGIPASDLPRIFDPFYTRLANGTGLGLTIVRRIIEQHHGTIEVKSEPGRGTVFTLHLPIRQLSSERP